MARRVDLVITNIGQLVTFWNGPLTKVTPETAVILENAAIAVKDGIIVDVGRASEITSKYTGLTLDAGGRLVTPGLVDSHTHLLFAGSREDEFELKLMGVPYSEILERGGGIYRTVRETRRASDEVLVARAASVLDLMVEHGTTTVEVKSGYDLTPEGELRLLRIIRNLDELHPVRIVPTLLAHVVPEEYSDRRSDYVKIFADEIVPRAASEGLAVYLDVFCDRGAFNVEETRIILESGLRHGLRLRLHADEIAYIGCSRLAGEYPLDALDHLEFMPPENARLLAEAGATAGLLPTSLLAVFSEKKPPVQALREAGVPLVVASDFNPNNMTPHVQLAVDISTYIFGLTPLETLAAATINAAKSLGLHGSIGRIRPGFKADIVVWDVENYRWIGYVWGVNKVLATIINGAIVYPEMVEEGGIEA